MSAPAEPIFDDARIERLSRLLWPTAGQPGTVTAKPVPVPPVDAA